MAVCSVCATKYSSEEEASECEISHTDISQMPKSNKMPKQAKHTKLEHNKRSFTCSKCGHIQHLRGELNLHKRYIQCSMCRAFNKI